ncbi:unnamed protein product [Auanema sp. JU1783]|nr:unnamed protein product [Auanema sp. JU1783]
MARMYVIVNAREGDEMNTLMMTLANKHYTFSVTDNISKICTQCLSQTANDHHSAQSSSKCEEAPKDPDEEKPMLKESENEIILRQSCSTSHDLVNESENCSPPNSFEVLRLSDKQHAHSASDINSSDEVFVNSPRSVSHLEIEPMDAITSQSDLQDLRLFFNALKEEARELPNDYFHTNHPQEEPIAKVARKKRKTKDLSVTENDFYPGHILKQFSESFEHSSLTDKKCRDVNRGKCNLCKQAISVRNHHMKRHAITHLGYKTFQCRICKMLYNRGDMCKPHFERHHPEAEQVPFEDVITDEQSFQLQRTLKLCFPDNFK